MATEDLTFRAFGVDAGAGRMFEGLADHADDASTSIHGLGDESKDLDARLDETRLHLRALISDFESTGDRSLFRDFRRDRGDIAILQAMRKEVASLGDDGDDVGRRLGTGMSRGLSDTFGALPSQLKGAAIVGLVGLAAVAAPAIGAAVGGAVVGGVGLGGIVGGVALASQDPRVKDAGKHLGQTLFADLKSSADPFIEPLLKSFGELEETGATFTAELHDGFVKLAPTLGPLTAGIQGLVRDLGPGLSDLFTAAQPAIRAVANELPQIGSALSDLFTSISNDQATEGLIGLLDTTEALIVGTGDFIYILEREYGWLVDIGAELDKWKDNPLTTFFGGTFEALTTEATNVKAGLDKANDASGDWETELRALLDTTEANTRALRDFSSAMQEEFDPISTLLHRTQDLKSAQQDLSEAIKSHGKHSDQAKAAELRLAEAILASDAAAANAAGTFDGHFTPAMRATLRAGGLLDSQIDDLEHSARGLRHELENLQGSYNIKVRTEFIEYRRGERNPSGRAAGGPVEAGRTYWVGEQGPELVTFGRDGRVTPAGESAAMARGWGSSGAAAVRSVEGHMDVTVNASGVRDGWASLFLEMLRTDTGFRYTVAEYVNGRSPL